MEVRTLQVQTTGWMATGEPWPGVQAEAGELHVITAWPQGPNCLLTRPTVRTPDLLMHTHLSIYWAQVQNNIVPLHRNSVLKTN